MIEEKERYFGGGMDEEEDERVSFGVGRGEEKEKREIS